MKTIVFLIEERSAEEMLKAILPQIIPDNVHIKFITFEGKSDLEKNVERRIKFWNKPESYFIIMRDGDSGDCIKIKNNLLEKCRNSGKKNFLVRIACQELESFFLGDLEAVEKGLGITGLKKMKDKKKFRNPDLIHKPSEELIRITKNKYQKIAGTRAISPYLSLDSSNRSRSFNTLINGIRHLASEIMDS